MKKKVTRNYMIFLTFYFTLIIIDKVLTFYDLKTSFYYVGYYMSLLVHSI